MQAPGRIVLAIVVVVAVVVGANAALAARDAASIARSDRVDRMTNAQLEKEARRVARSGGILCTRWACATPYLKRLSYELVDRAFAPSYRRWAHCIVDRESGYNPGAVSRTDDHNLAQFNRPSWSSVLDFDRLAWDPVYGVRAFVRVSGGGTHTRPWDGAPYSC